MIVSISDLCLPLYLSTLSTCHKPWLNSETLQQEDRQSNTSQSMTHARIQKEEVARGSGSPGKSQLAIGFFRKIGTDHLEKQLEPLCQIAS